MINAQVLKGIKRINVFSGQSKQGVANVIVAKKKVTKVSGEDITVVSSQQAQLVKTPTLVSLGVQNLADLSDVNTDNKVQGAAVVYNANNSNYEVRQLTIEDIQGVLKGGTF